MNFTYWPHWALLRDSHDEEYGCPGSGERWEAEDEAVTASLFEREIAGPDGNTFGWHIWMAGDRLLCEREALQYALSPSSVAEMDYWE